MKWNLFISSVFRLRNLGFLFLWIVFMSTLNTENYANNIAIWSYVIGLAGYFALVIQSVYSKTYQDHFLKRERLRKIRRMNADCIRMSSEVRRLINFPDQKKIRKILSDKDEVIRLYNSKESNFISDEILEKSLNLVYTYFRLMKNYYLRSKDLSKINLNEISTRLSNNSRKVSFIKDEETTFNLKRIIENDEKIIENFKREKVDLERIKAKMEYMESTINILKHQILTSFDADDFSEKLDDAINEAEALGNALEIHKRSKVRL